MFIEVTGQRQGYKAWLVSSPMSAPSGICTLRVWYHMKGSRIQDLNIWYRTFKGGSLYAVASQSGTQGDVWYKITTTIDLTKNSNKGRAFEVIIEGLWICNAYCITLLDLVDILCASLLHCNIPHHHHNVLSLLQATMISLLYMALRNKWS